MAIRRPRYWRDVVSARRGYRAYGGLYENPYIFVAGMPKSGTSWVEGMLAHYPGYTLIAHPEVTAFGYERYGSHQFEMPGDFFSRLGKALCVIKIHCHGSTNNVSVLGSVRIPYVIMYRDLRDAAVSHACYVKRTPWHSEYPVYRSLNEKDGLLYFAGTLLGDWRDWIESWKTRRDPVRSIEVRYEDLVEDTETWMRRIARLYKLPEEPLSEIIEANVFTKLRKQGDFFRRGIAGDWVNHFDEELKDKFKAVIGDDLVRWGYEEDLDW